MIAALESTAKPVQWTFTQFQTSKTVTRKTNRFNCLAAATNQSKIYSFKRWQSNRKKDKNRGICKWLGRVTHLTESSEIQSTKDLKPFWKAGTNGSQAEPSTRRRTSNRKKGRDRTEPAEIWSQKENLTIEKVKAIKRKMKAVLKINGSK
jgi:hypothetical protein